MSRKMQSFMINAAVAILVVVLTGCGNEPVRLDAADDAADDATDATATDITDIAGPDTADATDVVDAADATDATELPRAGWWTTLEPSGPAINEIAGIASQMSTNAAPNDQRDFEYAQYKPFPGFRMRNGHRFDDVERTEGVWEWDRVSGSVDGAAAVGSKVLMGFDYGVDWAMDGDDTSTLDLDAFATYAGEMAGHFCDTVKEFEIWNEPNLAIFWKPSPDASMYADMVKLSYTAIKAKCPDARVAFGAMASFGEPDIFKTWEFFRQAYQARPEICDYMDALSMHPYTWVQYASPEHDEWVDNSITLHSQTEMVTIAREMLAEAGCGDKALWFTEVGWPSYELTEETVARYAMRSLFLTARDGVEAWCWYTFWDREPTSEGIRPHENYFGMFRWPGADGTVRQAKPAWNALVAGLEILGTYRFAGDISDALGLPEDVYALAFTGDDDRTVIAAWDGRDQPDITADGPAPGGPATTFEVEIPVPDDAVTVSELDMYGDVNGSGQAPAKLTVTLSPAVTYLTFFRGAVW